MIKKPLYRGDVNERGFLVEGTFVKA